MAERDPYVRHGARRGGLAALGGILIAGAILAGIAWGVTRTLGDDDPAPPPTQAADTTPALPVLKIVFPEGFTRADMAKRIGEVNKIAERRRKITPKLKPAAYLGATRSGPIPADFKGDGQEIPNLEGFLFPATYEFTEETTSKELSRKQLEAFDRAWSDVNLDYAKEKNLTAYDVLIIASMVEKEVQVPKERALVAAVIYNRLKAGMPLGIDATIRYGLDIPPTQAILQSQLDSDSPYNTRCRGCTGLPPTPISNPGLASIQAAAHPAKTDFLYFVRKADCKSHFFTADEQEFLNYPRGGLQC